MKAGRLAGKVAWVSGGTSGIGKATAQLFAEEGAKVIVAGRSVREGDRIVKGIRGKGGKALFTKCDVSRPDPIRKSIERGVKEFGALDVLVNNAGMVHVKMLHNHSNEDWDYLMAVNVK